jgi:diguanylate cyclase (GGDEF)-like protein
VSIDAAPTVADHPIVPDRDPLTGLATRDQLVAHLEASVGRGAPLSVALVDVDGYRRIDESVAAIVLQSLASRMVGSVPAGGLIARIEADRFALVLDGLGEEQAGARLWELLGRLAEPLSIGGRELRITASAGLASLYQGATPDSLLRDADAALTRAKTTHRGGVVVAGDELHADAADLLAGEFCLYFQPIVHLSTGRLAGYEASPRLTRSGGGVLSPEPFLPAAEDARQAIVIGEWAIEAVIAELCDDLDLGVSINLSARHLAVEGLVDFVERTLHAHQVSARRLAFEVPETEVDAAAEVLAALRRLGCFVGLDCFGTDSSLGQLHRLAIDFIKLDRSLVEAIDNDSHARTFAATIVAIAQALGLATVAQGVERASLAEAMTAMGCEYGQGWHFGRPARGRRQAPR